MITPVEAKQISIDKANIEKIISDIDSSIKNYHGWYPWEEAVIDGEYPNNVMDAILEKYFDVGWKFIFWNRSSEQGERAGLTNIMFSTSKIAPQYISNKHQFVKR